MKEVAHISMLVLAAITLFAGGCANDVHSAATVPWAGAMSGETYTLNPPQAVLDTSEIAAYRRQWEQWAAAGRVADQPWWADRNDARLNLRPGGNAAAVTDYLIHVHDRQYSSNGHISDTYRRDSYSNSYGRIAN
ncbi:MAG: hypothetical protein ACYC26_17880 [Phycisphaerales bacterium]